MSFHFPTTDIRKSDYDTLGYLCVMQNKPTSQKILFGILASIDKKVLYWYDNANWCYETKWQEL